MIQIWPATLREGGSAIVIVTASPRRTIEWSVSGLATLTALSHTTDAQGRAFARLDAPVASATSSVIVGVSYGA